MVKHYNNNQDGKAIIRHGYNRERDHYWDVVYYHCDSQREEFKNLLRTYVSNIPTGKGCLLGVFPVCAYVMRIDLPTGDEQLGLALVPIFGWIANSLLYHVGMVVQADNGKWYAMQKESNGTNTMAEYNSFAEARDRIYRTCRDGVPGREWSPCSSTTPISIDALSEFNANYKIQVMICLEITAKTMFVHLRTSLILPRNALIAGILMEDGIICVSAKVIKTILLSSL